MAPHDVSECDHNASSQPRVRRKYVAIDFLNRAMPGTENAWTSNFSRKHGRGASVADVRAVPEVDLRQPTDSQIMCETDCLVGLVRWSSTNGAREDDRSKPRRRRNRSAWETNFLHVSSRPRTRSLYLRHQPSGRDRSIIETVVLGAVGKGVPVPIRDRRQARWSVIAPP